MSERAEEPKEVVKIDVPDAFLATSKDTSFEGMAEYRILSRLKVIQPTAAQDLIAEFGLGSVILSPGGVRIVALDEQFLFVPVFFFVEFCKWSDLDDKASAAILDRTYDKASDIARRSRSAELREEEYAPGLKCRYVEHLNFAGFIYGDHEQAQTPVVLGFCRGEHSTGTTFINSIQLRKVNGNSVKLYGQVWKCGTNFRDKGPKKKWYGIDCKNPEVPFVKPEEFEFYEKQHEELKAQHAERLLFVDREDEGKSAEAVTDSTVQANDEM